MNSSDAPTMTGSVRDVLRVAGPLVLAASSHGLKLFADRVMLMDVSAEAVAAALSGGIMFFTVLSLAMGIVSYSATFVSQFTGAKRDDQVGPAVWQGIWLAVAAGLILATGWWWGGPLFALIDHVPSVQTEQARYFSVLSLGAVFPLIVTACIGFWSGRGKTWAVLAIEASTVVINVVLNALLIFGLGPFPALGILGAGIATVVASSIGALVVLGWFLSPAYRERYATCARPLLRPSLMRRLIRFGLPNGVHFALDVASFNMFTILLGWQGAVVHAAGSIAFAISSLAYIPLMGLGLATTVLVGQAMGAQDPRLAERVVASARRVYAGYILLVAGTILIWPDVPLMLFDRGDPGHQATLDLARGFIRIIGVGLLIMWIFMVHVSAIKGAGDTRFAALAGLAVSWGVLVIPGVLIHAWDGPLWGLWACFIGNAIIASLVFVARYRWGPWRRLRVIEHRQESD